MAVKTFPKGIDRSFFRPQGGKSHPPAEARYRPHELEVTDQARSCSGDGIIGDFEIHDGH